jgi:M6 family metalloprotease-like protein
MPPSQKLSGTIKLNPRTLPKSDWPGLLRRKRVSIQMEKEHFVGSFSRVYLELRGLGIDDLEFHIPAGAKAGVVSLCRDNEFDPKRPEVMFCAGYEPGAYVLQAIDRATNIVLDEETFEVTSEWADQKNGPSLSFTGIAENLALNPAWGGGPAGPQNVNVLPASGTRRIAIALIDTADARYTSDAPTLAAIRQRWMNEVIDGVTSNGRVESARTYYREVSYNNYDLSADIFGPINLPNNWSSYFAADGAPTGAFWQQAMTACDATIDYNNYDNLIFVSEQFFDAAGAAFNAWPYGGSGVFATAEGTKTLGVVSMPREWGAAFRPTRTVRSTVIHELGHSLGLSDQYRPDTGRNAGNWEPMHAESNLPHFSIAHRMMLGWVQPGWLKTYNFANGGGVVDETVSLSPIETGAPAAGTSTGIEVRLSDGWNYYVEYRAGQTTQIGDRALDTPNAVLVTDVDSTPGDAPISRPLIIRVRNDADGDGSVLVNGLDYRETDSSDPTFPTDFRMRAVGVSATKADIKVEYGVNSRPDPAIRPWPASADRQWQSPDIEVQNERNLADPAGWFNVPWAGHDNTVIASVKNNGNLAAPGVRVEFYVKNFNVGGAPETFLGADVRDIPALGTTQFTTLWNPPGNGHYCLAVRIPGYLTPGPSPVLEMSIFNNQAQSNYTRFISAEASPASRETTFVEVGNPYSEATRVFIRPGQTNPLYRTYLEHTCLHLEPGETRRVKLMFEYDPSNLYTTPVSLGKTETIDFERDPHRSQEKLGKVLEGFRGRANRVGLAAYIDNPSDPHPHTPSRLGGADAEIATGKRTKFEYFYLDNHVGGRVILDAESRAPAGVTGGSVILSFRNDKDPGKPRLLDVTTKVEWDGRFAAKVPDEAEKLEFSTIEAYYAPAQGYGECHSEVISRR